MNKINEIIKICKDSYSEKDYKYHILSVVKYALILAKKLNADLEIVEVSAYLHDIGRATKRNEFVAENEHHIIGAKKAREILKTLKYSEEFIKKVEHCVLAHRGRREPNPETLEARIISCADAMSHFDTFLDLFSFFLETTDNFEKAVIEIEQKMDRNWNKKLTLPEAKEMVRDKYEAIMVLIKSMKEHF
ncbi:MAG: HD domain-containing protein [Nanoarchaeota archaeon]